ncbi:replication restart helicase PriA [Pedobacter duraquae]|uniref:Replication restart protein PriA n=1 Tax=Pedobacter duraquae TaxID=425511 RepID=A0A4R6IQD2_9SPHI|nr:primosomal protein N' [Pedobacter duraquae]TDO24401.1 replication restart DNA helicase PriA [Pedobacter duraquae]
MQEENYSIFEERETLFVEVILPLSLAKNYLYRVPYELNDSISVGKRVIVQFGKNKIYTALIRHVISTPPELYEAKYILDVVDAFPVVNENQFRFWNWMTSYYMCNEGDVMSAALPSGLKLASETIIVWREDTDLNTHTLSEKEQTVIDFLIKNGKLSLGEISKILGQKTVIPLVKSLLDRELVYLAEEVIEKYKPLLKPFLILNPELSDGYQMGELFKILEKAPKQLDALMAFIQLSKSNPEVGRQELLEYSNCGQGAIKSLIDKDVFLLKKKAVSRLRDYDVDDLLNFKLSGAQEVAFHEVERIFKEKDVALLHGVTASGKTQLYIKLIEDALKNGGQALFLLPEIALTTQIVERIKHYFGEAIGVYHSKFNDFERVEIWNKVLNGTFKVVLGARSAVFLPFNELKIIVVDEEHESSYKQHDPAPRYQARDSAIYLALLHGAKIVLGSATPSLESYYNALTNKYGLVKLQERFSGVELPLHQVVSISDETKRKKMVSYFSSVLIDDITEALEKKEQIILFQNRRGYATILICATCGYAPKCINCDVSLTYHKSSGKLHCHYCGYHQSSINICPACGSVHIEQKGFGTERIEEELMLIFPDITIARLDVDSTRTKNSLQKIITEFQEGKTNILIGTQMVAKGLDFDHVGLIGVINADTLLNYPDFRAFERSYQLLAQVSGRAGRRAKQGKVVIQAYDDDHRIIRQVVTNDYEDMYANEIEERREFNYPPFSRLIFVNLKHKDANVLNRAANQLADVLRQQLGNRILGPEQPLVSRVRNYYLKQIIIKSDKNTAIQKVKTLLKDTILSVNTDSNFKGVIVQIDVDPY